MAKLSICVPSRNRQVWFQETIRALLENPRQDVEFVFADNSDDAAVMADFMQEFAGDARIVFLPPGPRIYSMVDNWERTVAATSGEWVTVIGDDDYVDPDVASLIERIEALDNSYEALDWFKLDYYWPDDAIVRSNLKINPNSDLIDVPKAVLLRRLLLWEDARTVPAAGYSIYHSAISRPLLERIKARFGNRFFEHPTVDYDSAYKVVLEGRRFAYTSRPFSVHGRSPKSMSGSMRAGVSQVNEKGAEFIKELGQELTLETSQENPIDHRHGVSGSVLQAMLWICRKYGIEIDGWQENFVRACADNCALYHQRTEFLRICENYRSVFSHWADGRYLPLFNPVYKPHIEGAAFTGIHKSRVYILDDPALFSTPEGLYSIAGAMFETPLDMPLSTAGDSSRAPAGGERA